MQKMFIGVQLAQYLPVVWNYLLENLSSPTLSRATFREFRFVDMWSIIVEDLAVLPQKALDGCPGIIARPEVGHTEKRTQLPSMRPFPLKHDMIRIHTRRLVNNSVTEGTEHDEILECASRFLA